MEAPKTLSLRNRWALGDTVCLSALVRDIHLAYPGRFRLHMTGHYPSFWEHNPLAVGMRREDPAAIKAGRTTTVTLEYAGHNPDRSGIRAAGRGEKVHFLSWFHRDFGKVTGLSVPVTQPKGHIPLSPAEERAKIQGRYWIISAGGKRDMTTKVWSPQRYQQVANILTAHGIHLVQLGLSAKGHYNFDLSGVTNLVGATPSIRDLFGIIKNAEGVICGITSHMHLAAVWDKPCVVIAGGREEPWWEAYSNAYQPTAFGPTCAPVAVEHRYLHTLGLLDCCEKKGCWKSRTVPLEPQDHTDQRRLKKLCKRPLRTPELLPECLDLITPDHVVEAVMSYYESGQLPPVGQSARTYSLPTVVVPPPPLKVASELKPEPSPVMPPELPATAGEDPGFLILDNSVLGGKITCFVLCYGDHADLARRCLESILGSVPSRRLDLRVGLNAVCQDTRDYVRSLNPTRIYDYKENRRKYPVMRTMFHDPDCPILTPYLVWFDDDSYVVDRRWLVRLADSILANHQQGARMYGIRFVHDIARYARNGHRPDAWFKAATWWRGQPFVQKNGTTTSPNASHIGFVSGGFWALHSSLVTLADIPDRRLANNGGDITLGAHVHQAGALLKDFNRGKKYVHSSGAPRRGVTDPFPWIG